jgi:hypothetical protein
MATTIKQQRMLDTWMTMVLNGAGNRERVYRTTEEYLENSGLPGVVWKRDGVSAGILSGSREFLVVTHTTLSDYKMFLCARDYGAHLDCAWYLTCRPTMFKKMVSKYAAGNPNTLSMNLSVFSQQDLSAWGHVVHQAFTQAIRELMEGLKQDISRMNTQSKGYLSVW